MRITLIQNGHLQELCLPKAIKGKFYITDDCDREKLLLIDGVDNQWLMKQLDGISKLLKVVNFEGEKSDTRLDITNGEIVLKNNQMIIYRDQRIDELGCVMIADDTVGYGYYMKYKTSSETEISVGNSNRNSICYQHALVSDKHCVLKYDEGCWNLNSYGKNGTFVNGQLVENTINLAVGDVIRITDLIIVVGNENIAVNNPNNAVKIGLAKLEIKENDVVQNPLNQNEPEYYYRLPMFQRRIETFEMKIDPPPTQATTEEMPLIMMIGPSATMGMTSIATAALSVSRAITTGTWISAIPSMIMCVGMLGGTVMWPIITKKYNNRRKALREETRKRKYTEYLDLCRSKIEVENHKQHDILNENYPSMTSYYKMIFEQDTLLWRGNIRQNDFLKIKVGTGKTPLDIHLNYPERKFTIEEDEIEKQMYLLCEEPKYVNDVPITISLVQHYLMSIVIGEENLIAYVNGLVLQLIATYGYDYLKLVFIMDEEQFEALDYVKWLPHIWNDQHTVRFLATNVEETKNLSSYLDQVFEGEVDDEKEEVLSSPNYVVFALNRELALRTSILKRIYACKKRRNFSVISFVNSLSHIHKDAQLILQLRNKIGTVINNETLSGEKIQFQDSVSVDFDMEKISVILANTILDLNEDGKNLPKTYDFLKMMNANSLQDLNIIKRWSENDPTKSLKTPIGIDSLGDLIDLDLHQNNHGPHGLIAGMTGSGKSEFIISYILSLAVNYHPYEVAFVLIDYKGGGMAKTFEHLPHTVGIITNLDGSAIYRSLMSIESELKTREAIFAQAGAILGESNIDIYKYQKYYREGKVNKPLPHLFVISDEFAELKSQQPEFMQQLISTARIGRSLGVHLILATQKPAGVVDDQIWSNSRFRICLKVQDKNDSMDMLKRPEAALLVDTGRFYIQVGYDEIFELGQSAWAGAPYQTNKIEGADGEVSIINHMGTIVMNGKVALEQKHVPKQVDCIVEYLQEIAKEEQLEAIHLWETPLDEHPVIDDLELKYHYEGKKNLLNPLVGEIDIPSTQQKCALCIPISEKGNVLVYGIAEGGKTTFINAILYSLIKHHTQDELSMYIMDFYTETLGIYRDAPQVSDVLYAYDKEKISKVFKKIMNVVADRRKVLAQYGGNYQFFLDNSSENMQSIVVVIHNYQVFRDLYDEENIALEFLAREGLKYGIYFILSATGYGSIRMNMLQNFKLIYALQLNDPSDYPAILGKTEGVLPESYKGRGLCRINKMVNEFQTAYIDYTDVPKDKVNVLVNRLKSEDTRTLNQSIQVIPERISFEYISSVVPQHDNLQWPIGIDIVSEQPVLLDVSSRNIHLIPSSQVASYAGVLRGILNYLPQDEHTYVLDAGNILQQYNSRYIKYANNLELMYHLIEEFFDELVVRHNHWKDIGEPSQTMEEFPPVYLVISNLSGLLSSISEDDISQRLDLIMSKTQTVFNVFVFIGDTSESIGYARAKWYVDQMADKGNIWIGPDYRKQRYAYSSLPLPKEYNELRIDQGVFINVDKVTFTKYIYEE